jgi:RNA polymerase sigma-70 factor (ECF subfamily)
MDYFDDVTPSPECRPRATDAGQPSVVPAAPPAAPPPTPRLAADPDADVLGHVDRGDHASALRVLMHRHGAAVYRFCREALHDPALADDVHQQIFIDAFRDFGRFRRSAAMRAWLFGIARHRVLDAAKSRRRARAWIDEADPTELADLAPPPSVVLDDAQLHDVLIACLRELDEDVRSALLLRYQQGFTFEEMAKVCGEKSGTLHARVTRALPLLRARIERRLARARAKD